MNKPFSNSYEAFVHLYTENSDDLSLLGRGFHPSDLRDSNPLKNVER